MPSIVPADNDETVYLVAGDFGQIGRAWRESDYDATDLEIVIQDLLSGSTEIRSASSLSIRPNTGPRMFRRMSPASCAGAAISS